MPHLTQQIGPGGPILDLFVGVSFPRSEALRKAGRSVPNSVRIKGLIDTGASCTCIDPTILSGLGLVPTGTTQVHTPSTSGAVPHIAKQFDVSLVLPHSVANRTFIAVPVIESQLLHQGIHALIGRDILSFCLMTYDGQAQTFCLGF
jgi:predicted aspartyl protease